MRTLDRMAQHLIALGYEKKRFSTPGINNLSFKNLDDTGFNCTL